MVEFFQYIWHQVSPLFAFLIIIGLIAGATKLLQKICGDD